MVYSAQQIEILEDDNFRFSSRSTLKIMESNIGGYMKFRELPQKWKMTVTILRILAVGLPIAFLVNFWVALGSLIKVMVG